MTQTPQRESPEYGPSAHRPARSNAPVVAPVNALWNHVATMSDAGSSVHDASARQVIQPKLEIGSPDDEYEREADRVADMVMRMPEPGAALPGPGVPHLAPTRVQRACTECEEETAESSGSADGEPIQTKRTALTPPGPFLR